MMEILSSNIQEKKVDKQTGALEVNKSPVHVK